MRLVLSIALFFTALSFKAIAAPVVIKGNIKGENGGTYANKPVKVTIINDFITNTKKVIKASKTDAFGNYKLSFDLKQTEFAFVEFDKIERTLFIEPGKSYFITVKAPIKDLERSHGYFAKDVRKANITNKRKLGINNLIDSVDRVSSDFLYNQPVNRRSYKRVKRFADSLNTGFQTVKNPFFQKYLKYKTGELMMYVLRTYRKDFAKMYFDNESAVCDNIQSMHVFNSFFKGHMKNGIQTIDSSPFHKYMIKGDLERMLSEVYKSGNYNRELNELILLKGLFEISNSNFYRKSRLNYTLEKLAKTTKYPLHKEIAYNIQKKLNHLESGYPAPDFEIAYEGTNFKLSDYKGKYVYMCFFKGWDESFKEEIKVINYLKQRYEEDLRVVCIATDIDKSTYDTFIKSQEDKKDFYYYNFNIELLTAYRIPDFRVEKSSIEGLQKYFLIGPKGKIIYGDAKKPTKGFEYDLRKIIIQ